MNPPDNHLPPDDPETLLRSGLRDTTPDFERRWVDLKRELRTRPAPRAAGGRRRWWWTAVPAATAAALVLALLFLPRPAAGPAPAEFAAYEELFRLDDELRSALPLAEDTLLDDLLAMPAPTINPS